MPTHSVENTLIRRVYIDQSHEFRFAAVAMGKMLAANGYSVISSLATLPPKDLGEFDVLSLHQWGKPVPYDEEALQATRQFVNNGGGLYIVGVDTRTEHNLRLFSMGTDQGGAGPVGVDTRTEHSLRQVVELFGYSLKSGRGKQPISILPTPDFGPGFTMTGYWPNGVPWFIVPQNNTKMPATILACEATGNTVAVAFEYGKGRVCIVSDPSFIGEPTQPEKMQFMLSIFAWLSRNTDAEIPQRVKQPGMANRHPDLILKNDFMDVMYPKPLEQHAQTLIDEAKPIVEALTTFFGKSPRAVRIIAITGGGSAGGDVVAIGVVNTIEAKRGFLLWELTNSTPLPSAPGIGESWAVFTGRVLGPNLKTGLDPDKVPDPWAAIEKQVLPDDPKLDKYDVSIDVHAHPLPGKPKAQPSWIVYRKKKCALILRDLYTKYGVDFIRCAVVINDIIYGGKNERPTFDQWVRLLSLAAGEDVTPIFKRYGTTVGNLNLPDTREGILKEREEILAQRIE